LGSNSLAHLDEITIVVRVVVCKQRQTFFRAFAATTRLDPFGDLLRRATFAGLADCGLTIVHAMLQL
jgi:hypothetical protein